MTCPNEHELVRAHQLGDDSLAGHVTECARCSDAWDGFERTIRLARELAVEIPPLAHREEVRTALLATPGLPHARSRWNVRAAWLGAAAVAAGTAVWLVRTPDEPVTTVEPPHVAIRATTNADYTTVSSELVRLRDGTIALDVEPLRPGERFRVVIGDGDVEVRGTSFEVTAVMDHMVGVRVMRGRVEVRPVGATTTILEPGQSWHVQIAVVAPVAPPLPVAPVPAPTPPTPPTPRTRVTAHFPSVAPVAAEPAPIRRSPDELAYNDAWDAMRAGDFRSAAAGFARVHLGPLADEAAFWRAVALARGGRAGDAIVAFRAMLDGYPSSPRIGEASAMLGWLLVDAHQLDEATRRFEAATDDRAETVRDSARRGLGALRKH